MSEQRVATLIVEVAGRQTNLDQLLRRLQQELRRSQTDAGSAADAIGGKLAGGQQKGAQSALSHAQALARLAAAEGNTAEAVEILKRALDSADKSTTQAIRAQTQLAQLQGRLRGEIAGTRSSLEQLSKTASGFGAALGAAGFAIGIQQLGQFAIGAAQQANQLEKVQASLRAVAGDQRTYNEALSIAEANQRLFGGTLAANIAPLQQFLFISNRTGASLQQLNDVAQLLATVNPAAGIEGAGFSLSEALSGDVTSIVERFNLPRAAIRELLKESQNAGEVLDGITALLAEQGVTAETLSASLNTTASTYDRLGAAISNATTQLGSYIAQALQPAALGLTALLTGNAEVEAALGQQAATIATANGAYAEYAAAIQQANAAATQYNSEGIGPTISLLPSLTEAQYTYLQALLAQGVAYGDAQAQAQTFGQELTILGDGTSQVTERSTALSEAQALLAQAQAEAEAATAAHAAATSEATVVSQAYAEAISLESGALTENLAKKLEGEIQTQRLAEAQSFLASLGSQVASGLLTAAQAASQLAAKYGIASAEAARLIQLQATLARSQAVANAGFSGVPEAYLGAAIGGRAGGSTTGPSNSVLTQIAAEGEAASKRYEAAVANYEKAEARAAKGGGGGGRAGGGGGKTPKVSQAEREQRQLAEQERKFQEQRLKDQEKINQELMEAEEEHYERLLDIQEEYEEKSLKQQRENEVSKRRSKFDFYSSLTEAQSRGDIDAQQAQQLSAAYEQAYAESQRIAQEGNQQLAAEYLELKQRQIEAELEFQEAIAAAREKGDKAEIARLERLAALRRDAEAEELKQLLEDGDQNANERDEALAEESERYAADQAKIADAAEEAGNRKAEAAKKSTEAIQAETQALREQADLLEQLNKQKLQNPSTGATATPQGSPVSTDPAASNAPQTADPAAAAAAEETELAALLGQLVSLQEANNAAITKVAKAIERLGQSKPFQ